jgi:hypothetical protein
MIALQRVARNLRINVAARFSVHRLVSATHIVGGVVPYAEYFAFVIRGYKKLWRRGYDGYACRKFMNLNADDLQSTFKLPKEYSSANPLQPTLYPL